MDLFWLNVIANVVLWGSILLGTWWMTWKAYFGPKSRAIKTRLHRVPIFFGIGELVLWDEGTNFVFLRNKQVEEPNGIGDVKGGIRRIYTIHGQEAIGPIPQRTELVAWKDFTILTRDAQRLTVDMSILWKVADPRLFAFRIAGEVHHEAIVKPEGVHKAAIEWLKTFVGSAARTHLSPLSILQVVSPKINEVLGRVLNVQPQAGGMPKAEVVLQPTGQPSPGAYRDTEFERAILLTQQVANEDACPYGIAIDRVKVGDITLPEQFQQKLNDVINASFDPGIAENKAEAKYKFLEKLADLLGKDAVAANLLLENFRGASFGLTLPPWLAQIFQSVTSKVGQAVSGAKGVSALSNNPSNPLADQTTKT